MNRTRRARLREEQFGAQAELCRTLPCLVCDRAPEANASGQSDPAHVVSRGAGGKDRGNVVPLCRKHHMRQHAVGWRRFLLERGYPADHATREAAVLALIAYPEAP